MNDADRRHGNDAGDARVIRRRSPLIVSVAIWQHALAEDWFSALGALVLAGRRPSAVSAAAAPRSLSSATWFAYQRTLRLWLRYLDEDARTDDPGTTTVLAYRAWLQATQPHLSVATINNRIDTIRAFYRWTASVGRFPDIAADVSCLTDPRGAPVAILSKREVQQMIARMGDQTIRDRRNRALVWVLFGAALETISLHRANIRDCDLMSGHLRHQPRGHRTPDVMTTLPPEAITAVQRYLALRRPADDAEPLFTSTRHAEPQRLSLLSMRLTVRRCLDAIEPVIARAHSGTDVADSTDATPTRMFVPSALRVSGLCHRLGGRATLTRPGTLRQIPGAAQAIGYRSSRAARNLIKRCLPIR
jgi:site-specific recombinase XerC